jgi:pimeloyl-ACP methyl ester carboxylesterase
VCWTRLARALEEDYDLIMLDARGHGFSDSGKGEYSTEARTADLIGVIEALELEKPVIGGHSMGALTSLHAAVQRPDLVAGFFMEDPSISLPGEPIFGRDSGKLSEILYKGMLRLLKTFKGSPKFMNSSMVKRIMPDAPPEDIEPWMNSKRLVSNDFVDVIEDPERLFGNFDFDLLDQVNSPAMLIYGDRDAGAILNHEVAQEMENRISGLRVVHFPGASHDIRRIRFDGYLAALKSFLEDIRTR